MLPREVLQKYFGYNTFRPAQENIIQAIQDGRKVLAIMPTGAGKSICFQVPALLFPYGTIVISPLISLMKDQVETLVAQGILRLLLIRRFLMRSLSNVFVICIAEK